ncbi:hypothetical protein Nepgr_001712 [Nepenthes gracilis]|uniref:Uncharacterized protein n=1 Tax=Nepenthes gracilis TaxID=150966 RepID=A0AAD3P7N4_NEPGR|nr:hypothetical protein Nepgr_001712 [Nepenthes gracilis]
MMPFLLRKTLLFRSPVSETAANSLSSLCSYSSYVGALSASPSFEAPCLPPNSRRVGVAALPSTAIPIIKWRSLIKTQRPWFVLLLVVIMEPALLGKLHQVKTNSNTRQITLIDCGSNNSMSTEENDNYEMDPFTLLLPLQDQDENETPTVTKNAANAKIQHCHIPSINSMLLIRQLPSEGLSFQLWPAANTLVSLLDSYRHNPTNSPLSTTLSFISNPQEHRRLRILELGSGTGFVGVAAATILGANVTVTDLSHVVTNLKFNAAVNSDALALSGGAVEVAELSWGDVDHMEAIGRDYDLVLGSDVVYHDHLYEPLIETLRYFLGGERKVVFLMAHLKRWKKESVFFKKAKKLFAVEIVHKDSPLEGKRVGVLVYRFLGKRQ